MRRVRATIVAVKRSKYHLFWVYVYSLSYAAYNAHALCCHLWPVRLDSISPPYLINGTIKKKILILKCEF